MKRRFINQHPVDAARAAALRIGAAIRTARAEAGLSQGIVAESVGTWQETVAKLERGNASTLAFATVLQLLDRVGLTIDVVPRRDEDIDAYRREKVARAERRRAPQIDLIAEAKAEYERTIGAARAS